MKTAFRKKKMRLKFKEWFDSSTANFRFILHKRTETKTFTLDLIARSQETKFIAFALRQKSKGPKPHVKHSA